MNINDRDAEEKMRSEIEHIVHPLLEDPMDMKGMYTATDRIMEVFKKYTPVTDLLKSKLDTPRTDAIDTYIRTRSDYTKTDHQVWREHANILETELAAFKKNNEELIQRHNAAIASWDEERERALREADRVKHWREKYEDLEKYIRFIGKQIPCNTGGTFENDPVDAILDAAVRALNDRKPTRVDELNSVADAILASWKEEKTHMKLSHEKTLDSLEYTIERTKVFEALAEMLYKADYDNSDAIKKIYETIREKYAVGTYYPPAKSV